MTTEEFLKSYNGGNRNFYGEDLCGVCLQKQSFDGCDLRYADFDGAFLAHADFSGAQIIGCSFRGARLVGAKMTDLFAYGCNFRGASLYCADFSGTNLDGSNFEGADIDGAAFDSGAIPLPCGDALDILQSIPQLTDAVKAARGANIAVLTDDKLMEALKRQILAELAASK